MKKLFLVAVALFFISIKLNAQTDTAMQRHSYWQRMTSMYKPYVYSNDTIIKKGVKRRVTNFAVQINSGGAKYFYDEKTKQYFGNFWSYAAGVRFYYKNFFFGDFIRNSDSVYLRKALPYKDGILYEKNSLETFELGFLFGYNINVVNNFSISPYLGYVDGGFTWKDNYYHPDNVGYTFGFSINKNIHLRYVHYLVVYFNNNINLSHYYQFSPSLGDFYYTFEFGLGYKGWITTKVKERNYTE